MARSKVGKAHGENMIVPDLQHRFPVEMAAIYYPIIFKSFCRLSVPIQ